MNPTNTLSASLIFMLCILSRNLLESHPVTHVLVQLPVLAWCGWVLARNSDILNQIASRPWNQGGFASLLVAFFFIVYWMLPKSIDAALATASVEVFKFVSVPLGIGTTLAMGWSRAHPILKGFLKANALSMLIVFAFLYTHAPVRICNAYLVIDQEQLGYGFLFAALGLTILWTAPLFSATQISSPTKQNNSHQKVLKTT